MKTKIIFLSLIAILLSMNVAAQKQDASAAVQSDLCNRTPLNLALPGQIIASLNLALIAEYLETEFYSTGLNTPGLIPNELRLVFMRILLNEVGHRETLLTVLGENAIEKPTFDFTARGQLPDVFTNFDTFIGLGQAFEDNGVRAIKDSRNVTCDKPTQGKCIKLNSWYSNSYTVFGYFSVNIMISESW